MTHLSKTVLALLLLAGGFVAARTFGPPDLAQRFVDSWRPEPTSQWGELRPAEPADHRAEYLAPLDAVEMPASFSSAYTQPQPPQATPLVPPSQPSSHAAMQPLATQPPLVQSTMTATDWPEMPGLANTTPNNQSWPPPASEVTPLTYQSKMVPLRAAPAPSNAPQSYETAKPAADPWLNAPAPALAPIGERQTPAQPAEEFEPWGAQPNVPSPPSQFIGYPTEATQHPLDAPVTAPAMWQAETTAAMSPLEPLSDDDQESAASRTHIVTDGDSLERLARRYLGDESRSSEIFERNREVLTHPDLLPLGVELQLP